jgi:5-methylcytosine-specific restriction enzyme A
VKLKERLVLEREGKLACEVCGFDFAASYGEIGVGFIEAHHLVPIAKLTKLRISSLSDLALVCSNCHRMLHKSELSVEALCARVQAAFKSSR